MKRKKLLVVGTIFALTIVVVILIMIAVRGEPTPIPTTFVGPPQGPSGPPPAPTPPPPLGPTPGAGPSVISTSVRYVDNNCRATDECRPNEYCVFQPGTSVGQCTTANGGPQSSCSRCVPTSSTALGPPDCLDHWETTSNSNGLLSKVADTFMPPLSQKHCTTRTPHFELSYQPESGGPQSTCSLTFQNRCEP